MSNQFSAIIVGAGPAGLMTALELHRRGLASSIRILERSPAFQSVGDVFSVLAPALVTLAEYPTMYAEFQAISIDSQFSIWKHTGGKPDDPFAGRIYGPAEADWNQPGVQHAASPLRVPWLVLRADFTKMLLDEAARRGIKVEWGCSVTDYGTDEARDVAWVSCADGEKLEADVVIASDGVGTKSHWAVRGSKTPVQSSGYAIFRVVMPPEVALASDVVRKGLGWKIGDRPDFRFYAGNNQQFNLILSDKKIVYYLTHQDDGNASEGWHQTMSADKVLEIIEQSPGWDPTLIELIKLTPPRSAVDWKLMWQDPTEKWTSDSGRIVQIGDAAHTLLPTSGNGASQALEDALTLVACFAKSGKSGIPQATKVFNLLRFERCSTLQLAGIVNRQMFHYLFDEDFSSRSEAKLRNPETILSFGRWLWGHNVVDYVDQKYDAAVQHLTTGAPFESTNLPPRYKYTPWNMAEVLENERRGILTEQNILGDWLAED